MTPDGGATAAMTHPVEHLARTVATDAHTGQVDDWWPGQDLVDAVHESLERIGCGCPARKALEGER